MYQFKKHTKRQFYYFIATLFHCFIISCAQPSAPTGGTRDTTPPVVTKSNPENYSTNFHEKEIKIEKGAFRSGVISGDSIFYGSDDGYIYEFNKNNLDIKRKFFVGTRVTTAPIIYQNKH